MITDDARKIAIDDARKIAIDGCLFLNSLIKPNGKFVYGYDLEMTNTGHIYSIEEIQDYNILRHAGSLWAMLDVLGEVKKQVIFDTEPIRDNIYNSLLYLNSKTELINNQLVVCENNVAKLGGLGLTALTMLKYYSVFKSQKILKLGELLCKTIISWVGDDNLFKTHKVNILTGAESKFVSNFYPGEALLALCMYNKFIKSHNLSVIINNVITAYLQKRTAEGHIRDHWMAQAIEHSGQNHEHYAHMIADRTMKNVGNRVGPMACRAESMLAIYNITGNESYLKFARQCLDFQKEFQIQYGILKGAFLCSETEHYVRNDINQHNISSFIKYYRILIKKGQET